MSEPNKRLAEAEMRATVLMEDAKSLERKADIAQAAWAASTEAWLEMMAKGKAGAEEARTKRAANTALAKAVTEAEEAVRAWVAVGKGWEAAALAATEEGDAEWAKKAQERAEASREYAEMKAMEAKVLEKARQVDGPMV